MRLQRRGESIRPLVCGLLALAGLACAENEPERVPLAELDGETIYVDEVEGAVALRIYQHELDAFTLLRSEAERRIEATLLEREAATRGTTVEALLEEVQGEGGSVAEAEIDAYLAEHPTRPGTDPEQARIRVRHYLRETARLERRVAFLESLRSASGARILLEPPTPPRTVVEVAGAPSRGPRAARVEIVHFASFGSRHSARSAHKLERLRSEFPEEIRHVHRNLLNDRDELGLHAARVGFEAIETGRFWELHDALFDEPRPAAPERVDAIALSIGLSPERVGEATREVSRIDDVKRDIDAANAAGAPREPTLFINGRFVSGLAPYDEIRAIVAEEIEGTSRSEG